MFENGYIWNSTTCNCENGKYLGSIIDDSVITCYETIEDTKTVPTKTATTKTVSANLKKKLIKNFYILLTLLLIKAVLLITVSIYCYLIKHWAQQKHSLPNHVTNNNLKEVSFYWMSYKYGEQW